ncbi:Ger(x)C family spore germination protein [Lysinibacillus sp. NPDC097231]|uniref:Ger(x)C family spore germination protein n=1 Tax=Lysinibacillus sp. NPDC097231 TaxID=3364142 RepID=UPI00380B8627
MKTIIKFIIGLSATLLLSGCWDVSEPQRMYYINGVGVDYKDGQYEIYMQIINFANVAKTESPNPQAPQAEIGHAKGKTMEEAFFKMYRSIDQKVFWGHMNFVLFSEEALKSKNAIAIIDSFLRHRETRYQILAFCTQDSIKDILLVAPILNKSLAASKLIDPLHAEEIQKIFEPVDLRNLVISLDEPSHEVNIPYVSLLKEEWQTSKETTEETALTGVGVLSKNGFKGFIKDKNASGIQWMQKTKARGEVTFKIDGTDDDYLSVDLEKLSVKIEPIVKNNQVTFEVDMVFDATVNGFRTKITGDEIRKKVIEEVKKDIRATYLDALEKDIDIYRLSEQLYRKNVKAWKKYEKDGIVPLTEDSISKLDIKVNKVNPGRKTFAETIKK